MLSPVSYEAGFFLPIIVIPNEGGTSARNSTKYNNQQPTTNNQQPTTNNQQPTTFL